MRYSGEAEASQDRCLNASRRPGLVHAKGLLCNMLHVSTGQMAQGSNACAENGVRMHATAEGIQGHVSGSTVMHAWAAPEAERATLTVARTEQGHRRHLRGGGREHRAEGPLRNL